MCKLRRFRDFALILFGVTLLVLTGCESMVYKPLQYEAFNHREDFVRDVRVYSDNGHKIYYGSISSKSSGGKYGGSHIGGFYGVPEQVKVTWTEDRGWDEHHYEKIVAIPRPLPELIEDEKIISASNYNQKDKKRNYVLVPHFYDEDVQIQVIGDSRDYWEMHNYRPVASAGNEGIKLLWTRRLTYTEQPYTFTVDNQSQYLLRSIYVQTDRGSGKYLKSIAPNTVPLKQGNTHIMPFTLTVTWVKEIDGRGVDVKKEIQIARPLLDLERGQWYGAIKSDKHYNITLTFTDDDVSYELSVETKGKDESALLWKPVLN